MSNLNKRVRSSNWNEDEKRLLRRLVLEKINIIENKNTNTNTNQEKKAAWNEIHNTFNTLNSKKREANELYNQWRNIKNLVKAKESKIRLYRRGTGGGPPPSSPTIEDMEILTAIPNEFKISSNVFDSDGVYENKTKDNYKDPENTLRETDDQEIHDSECSTTQKVECSKTIADCEDFDDLGNRAAPIEIDFTATPSEKVQPILRAKKKKDGSVEERCVGAARAAAAANQQRMRSDPFEAMLLNISFGGDREPRAPACRAT